MSVTDTIHLRLARKGVAMMMKILIGYDGSPSADDALVDLRRAGLPREAHALVVSVAGVIMVPEPLSYEVAAQGVMSRRLTSSLMQAERQSARVLEEAKQLASQAKERLESYFPKWNVRAETLAGTASHELIRKADEWLPDLVVVGSHGRSLVSRLVLGSVSKKVVTDSIHSVRVTRGMIERDHRKPPRLMIGVNGSSEAEQAVRAVGNRVWPIGTQVRLIAVHDEIFPLMRDNNEESPLAAQKMMDWAENELSLIGLKVSAVNEKGDPRRVIVHEAQEWGADSIFVGGRRFSGAFESFRLGSVARALVTKAHCPVEVVRKPFLQL
jgi:nucleotide-binding universal stress UspA family protein